MAPPAIDPAAVAAHVADLRARIARAAPGRAVTVVAVTKGFGADAVRAALDAGIADIGENYAQELVEKAGCFGSEVRWHFIGRLQRNKVRALAPIVWCWHSVDRAEIVRELARRAPGARVCIQVNVSAEPQKGGCEPDDAPALVALARELGLDVRGLMCVAVADDADAAASEFARLDALATSLGLAERSMGMTDDLDLALAHGATTVRIGRALFGPRPRRTDPDTEGRPN